MTNTEHRLARHGNEYLMQWRIVNTETKGEDDAGKAAWYAQRLEML